jgi:hypothetical protein
MFISALGEANSTVWFRAIGLVQWLLQPFANALNVLSNPMNCAATKEASREAKQGKQESNLL